MKRSDLSVTVTGPSPKDTMPWACDGQSHIVSESIAHNLGHKHTRVMSFI